MYKDFLERLLSLRMFEGEGNGGAGGGEPGAGEGGDNNNNPPKTFTQEDLNRIAAQEKRQGVSSILKALGFESEEDAKKYVDTKRKEDNDKKGDLEKAQEEKAAAEAAQKAAEKQTALIEKKYKVAAMGVPKDNIDDIVVLASAKESDDKTFDQALEEIKKSYPMLFTNGTGGTGGSGNPPRGGKSGSEKSMGKRLAEQRKSSSTKKDDLYFTR